MDGITSFEGTYICNACGNEQVIKSTQPVLCSRCHNRTFRKVPTASRVRYLAR